MKLITYFSFFLFLSCKTQTNEEKVLQIFNDWHKNKIKNYELIDSSNCNYEFYSNSGHSEAAFALVNIDQYKGDLNNDKKDDYVMCLVYDRCDGRTRGFYKYDEILLFLSEGDNYKLDDKFMYSILKDNIVNFDIGSIYDNEIIGWIYTYEQEKEFKENRENFAYKISYNNSSIVKADRNYWLKELNNVSNQERVKYKVVTQKTFFYKNSSESNIMKSYLLQDDIFYGNSVENGFINATFEFNGKKTIGWIKESDAIEIR